MKPDRFRPDAAARRVMPSDLSRDLARDRLFYGASFVDVTTTDGVVTSVERVPPTIAGNRGDRVIVDDPHCSYRCEHCGTAQPARHETCAPPFDVQPHAFTGKHPADVKARADALALFNPSDAEVEAAKASFEERRKPIASVGRNSIPKSHRGEGVNYVD